MADYLSNLIERFNQPAADVRARPISLFEPQTSFDFPAWGAAGTENIENQEMFEQSSDLQARATKSDSQQQSTTSAQTYMSRSEIKPRHHPVPAEQERPAAAPNSKLPTQLGYLVVRPQFQEDQSVLKPSSSEMIPAPQADQPRLEPERGANLEEGTPHLGGQATIRPKETPPNPGVKKIINPQLRKATGSPRSTQSNAQITAENNDAAPTESVINVTIGRVEVLAVPPTGPAKAPKASHPSPVMSLDEYLKNRDQERQP